MTVEVKHVPLKCTCGSYSLMCKPSNYRLYEGASLSM